MSRELTFYSDHFGKDGFQAEIAIEYFLSPSNEDEGMVEIEGIFDVTNDCLRKLSDFPKEEQWKIEEMLDEIGNDTDWYSLQNEAVAERYFEMGKNLRKYGES